MNNSHITILLIMWLEEALRVFTRLTAIKLLLQNRFVNT